MDLLQRPAGDGQISVSHLSKRFGPIAAVDDLSFDVDPGRVTGFLGPNGAGKTTTLRMLLGLVTPTSGTATIGGRRYADIRQPTRVIGAALEAASFHPGRSARNHLRVMALPAGIDDRRVDELLELVGLGSAAGRRVGGFSLGMRQRLALAGTLLGNPPVLLLDEPANGLDPEGIAWLRGLLRTLAAEGRTVLVSSHVLSEVQQTVDDVVIIARGKLVHSSDLAELAALAGRSIRVRTPEPAQLADLLRTGGLTVSDVVPMRPGVDPRTALAHDVGLVEVDDVDPAVVARLAADAGIPIFELAVRELELEQVFLDLVAGQS
jgi:ABC-2 type transport system ATP-binding protein